MVAAEIGASTVRASFVIDSVRSATLEKAGQLLQGYVERRGGELRFRGVLLDTHTNRELSIVESSAPSSGLSGAADAISRQLGGRLRPFGTQNPESIKAWGEAAVAGEGTAQRAALERSIQADPNFGRAYAELAQSLFAAGDRPAASAVIDRARQRLAAFSDVDRARVELIDAELKGNLTERRRALVALSRLVSTDPGTLRALGAVDLKRRDFSAAVEDFRNAVAIAPDDAAVRNELGYAEAYKGNLEAARSALEKGRQLLPGQANPIDSLGEVHFFLGKFEEAEKYFLEAQKADPAFLGGIELSKAAQSRLMRGDLAGADALYDRYLEQQGSSNPEAVIRRAQWLFVTGRHEQAFQLLDKLSGLGPAPAVFAGTQGAVWSLYLNDPARARSYVARCAPAPATVPAGALCRGLLDPAVPVPDPIRDALLRYRSLLTGKGAGVLPQLKAAYQNSEPLADGTQRSLYAAALVEAGNLDEAAPLVELYPLPLGGSDPMFSCLEFPRFLAARAAVRAKQGKVQEAAALRALFRQYSGQSPKS
jgi:tetratricopeptide (TPR) repeat protein